MNQNWINKQLANLYGQDDLRRPNFRVTWSEGQTEKRKCSPRIYLGDIFIRQEAEEVREVLKYPTIKNRFILERLIHHTNSELVENPSYEPIYVFDKAGVPLPLDWEMIQYACHYIMTGQVRNKQSYEEEVAKRDEQLKEETRAELKNDRPYIPTMIELGEAVSLPKVDYWKEHNGTECRSDSGESTSVQNQVGEANS